jgi:hypothetical protein
MIDELPSYWRCEVIGWIQKEDRNNEWWPIWQWWTTESVLMATIRPRFPEQEKTMRLRNKLIKFDSIALILSVSILK